MYQTAQAIRRRDNSLFRFAGSWLALVTASFLLLDIDGPGGSNHPPLWPLVSNAATWVSKAVALSVGGQAWVAATTQNLDHIDDLYVFASWVTCQSPLFFASVLGAMVGSVAVVSQFPRRASTLLGRTGLHFFVIAFACMAMVFSAHQFVPPSSLLDFSKRELYAPAILAFAFVSMLVAQAIERRVLHIAFAGAWLLASFPFGLASFPREPSWPYVGRAGWKHMVEKPQLLAIGRSCATINPAPWTMTGPHCQSLWGLQTQEEWATLHAFRDIPPSAIFSAPADADSWEVDSISLLVRTTHHEVLSLILRDKNEKIVGIQKTKVTPADQEAVFVFDEPIFFIRSVELIADSHRPVGVAKSASVADKPTWFWFGRVLQAPPEHRGT